MNEALRKKLQRQVQVFRLWRPSTSLRAGRTTNVLILLLLVCSTAPHAQSPVVDSANVARDAWRAGTKAYAAHDLRAAHDAMKRAATAWPTQPAYLWGRAITAAQLSDTADVMASLRAYLDVGLGRSIANDTNFRAFRDVPGFRTLASRLDSNIAPLARSRVVARLTDPTFWPEGVDFDPRTGNYYLASIRHRTIAELYPDGSSRELLPRHLATLGAMMGVRVDTARGVLWATMSEAPQMAGYTSADTTLSALLRIRIADGTIERRWNIPSSPAGHALGDLAIGPMGDVFMTDSYEPMLYRLRPGADTLERMTNPLFKSLQGMAPTPDGRFLYVADYSHGLLRVDLRTHDVVRLADAPGSTSLGCDGILLDAKGAIIAIQNGVAPARVMRYVLDPKAPKIVRAEVLDRNTAIADEPTIATFANGMIVYVANSQWEKYDDKGERRMQTPLTAPILLGVPLTTSPVRRR
jgi:sugar lactone lactonase YvrE